MVCVCVLILFADDGAAVEDCQSERADHEDGRTHIFHRVCQVEDDPCQRTGGKVERAALETFGDGYGRVLRDVEYIVCRTGEVGREVRHEIQPDDHHDDDDRTVHRRLGLAVSKSVGHAVTRNTVKRRFRVLARAHEDLLPAHCDIVLRAKPSAATASFASLDQQIAKAFATVAHKVAEA